MNKPVYCYIILCENNAFYTGWSTNPENRFIQHKTGKGSRYTKLNKPIKIIYWENCSDKSTALKRERAIKNLSRKQKENLITGWLKKMELPEEFNKFDYLSIAPGRVNILGEHIDYNGGSVLPAAIDRYVYLGANQISTDTIKITAIDLGQTVTFSIEDVDQKIDSDGNPLPTWALYPAGVIWSARKHNLAVKGFEGVFKSTVPMGTGLSSSAAVEVAFAALLREFCSWDIDNLELAKICQFAENQYIGVNCGLMDQFASANGINNSLLLFNTNDLSWSPVKLPDTVSIIITNSKVPRSLSNSAYNDRRKECEAALRSIQKTYPLKSYLCEVSPEELLTVEADLDNIQFKRAKHVIEECSRVNQAIDLLSDNQLEMFGKLMTESHFSLRDLYEVSTPELDTLVSIANKQAGCFGSRLTGAGFGGCIVSLVKKEFADKFVNQLEKQYKALTGNQVDSYICKASTGVKVQWRNNSHI